MLVKAQLLPCVVTAYRKKELQGQAKETLPGCIVCHASDYGQLVPPSAAAEGWEG